MKTTKILTQHIVSANGQDIAIASAAITVNPQDKPNTDQSVTLEATVSKGFSKSSGSVSASASS